MKVPIKGANLDYGHHFFLPLLNLIQKQSHIQARHSETMVTSLHTGTSALGFSSGRKLTGHYSILSKCTVQYTTHYSTAITS